MTTSGSALDPQVLLEFFDTHARSLPWRAPGTSPWGVLVSEIMLQQTQVARVVPAYTAWLRRWPTPASLAAESTGEAVRAWGGLGYPRRALRLHAAATVIAREHGGRVPQRVADLLTLPGIGAYTARAVAAFAYGARTPVVDTNVRRVLFRAVVGEDTAAPATEADRRRMEALLPTEPATAARFSIAVMELGALVCTAARPSCERCPVRDRCAWRASGYPRGTAPRRPAQAWVGTDRQARGRILAAVRASSVPIADAALREAWPDPEQRDRCLASLLADRLLVRVRDGVALPT